MHDLDDDAGASWPGVIDCAGRATGLLVKVDVGLTQIVQHQLQMRQVDQRGAAGSPAKLRAGGTDPPEQAGALSRGRLLEPKWLRTKMPKPLIYPFVFEGF